MRAPDPIAVKAVPPLFETPLRRPEDARAQTWKKGTPSRIARNQLFGTARIKTC